MDFSEYKTFDDFYEEINSALSDTELYYSLKALVEYFETKDVEAPVLASFRTLFSAFNQLLASIKELTPEAYKEKQDQIYRETWQLVDQERWNRMEHTPMIFAVDDLVNELDPQHLAEIGDAKLECIFNTIRTTYPFGKAQRNALHHAILSDQVPMYLRATLLSAMTLNVLNWFDVDLLECMYTYTLDDQPVQLRQQSWTALFLCGMVHDKRIIHYPRLSEQYLLLCEIEPSQLAQLQRLLLPLREYKSFSRDLHKLIDNMQQSSLQEDEEEQELHLTPDSDNFKQFIDLMHSNVDTGYSQFRLMSKLGFFSMDGTDHHWLMPFDRECEIVKKALEETPELEKWYQMLLHNQAQTNTDKYATFLIMSTMPRRMKDLNEKIDSLKLPKGEMVELGADMVMQIHLQDLYRFFTLSKTGMTLKNPFDLTPDLSSYQCFGKAFYTAENLRTVAEYLFKAEKYKDAAFTYERLLELEITQQHLKNAITSMQKSSKLGLHKVRTLVVLCNKLFPGDEDTLKQLIISFGFEDPLLEPYYKEALEYFPDSIAFLEDYGKFLNEAKRYSEALSPLYKAYMLDESNTNIVTEIAKAHLRLGQKDKAFNMIRRLEKPLYEELLINEILSNI